MTLRSRTLATFAASAAALVLFAGCSLPSTAFTVDGTTVSDATVNKNTEDCLTALNISLDAVGANRLVTVNNMLRGALATEIAKANNITITDAEAEEYAKKSLTEEYQAQLTSPACRALTIDSARFLVLASKMSEDKLVAAVADATVEVNPKYGTYDAATAQVPRQTSGSLSTTIDTYISTTETKDAGTQP